MKQGVRQSWEQEKNYLLDLYETLLGDLSVRYPSQSADFARDVETVRSRVRAEGIEFLTKVLPRLGKAIDESFDTGILKVPFGILKMSKKYPGVPAFLQGLTRMIYTSEGVLDSPDPDVIRDVRQACFLLYKYELDYTEEQIERVLHSFCLTDVQLPTSPDELECQDLDLASQIIKEVLSDFDPRDVLPKHGPGAVASGEKGDQKWKFSTLFSSIHQKYPYYDYFVVGGALELLDRKQWYLGLTRCESGTAKVVLVPKDSRGPRLISMEPLEYQWIQQGFNRSLVTLLESHRLTRGQVNFRDQSVNRQLAREGSLHHYWATLDMKDASDRVSLALVERLFPKSIVPYLKAIRSHSTRLPNGVEITLKKFAPMGSAVCFSIEAFVFWALLVAVVARVRQVPYRHAASLVYVYGDDLIIPSDIFEEAVEALTSVHLKVNEAKCFHRGDFRESCGMDAYLGVDVTPLKISTRWSSSPSSGEALASYTSYANTFRKRGYYALANFIFGSLARVHGKIPYGTSSSGYPCEVVASSQEASKLNLGAGIPARWNTSYQQVEFRVRYLKPLSTGSQLDGWPRLLRFTNQGVGKRPDEVVHPRCTKIARKWTSIFDCENPSWARTIEYPTYRNYEVEDPDTQYRALVSTNYWD